MNNTRGLEVNPLYYFTLTHVLRSIVNRECVKLIGMWRHANRKVWSAALSAPPATPVQYITNQSNF